MRDILMENTGRFAGRPARQQCAAVGRARHGQVLAGQGGHASINLERKPADRLKLIEIHREDIERPAGPLMDLLRGSSSTHRVLR